MLSPGRASAYQPFFITGDMVSDGHQAFTEPADFAAAKIAVFAGSISASTIDTALLWHAGRSASESAP